ncbi:Predicted acriflavin resistance protein [gamma proteobacterium HdN1]|nr:Predicted acriflavin resistance protein [gamma proteobacterium HdN1]
MHTTEKLGISGRIAQFFLASPLTLLLVIISILLGVWAVVVTPKEEEPQIDVTMANVVIPFPGANAGDVETLVGIPAEQVFSQMQGIDHVYTVSRAGVAVLTVQFKVGVTRNDALVRLYDTLHSHNDWLAPELGVGQPVIKPKGIDDVPIVSLTLWTPDPTRAGYDLERVSHAMELELQRVHGVRTVETVGGPGRELRIELDPDRLRAVELSALEVTEALRAANAAMPAGDLVVDNTLLRIESGDFLRNARDVESLVVGVFDGKPVYLASVAKIFEGPMQPSRYVWMGTGPAAKQHGIQVAGEFPAVTLAITKKAGENAVQVADALRLRVESLRGTLIPEGVELTITRNYGETANDKAMKLIQKLIFATFSVIALVFIALGRREAFVVGGAVLLTLAITLFASWTWGFTLNRVSLFALIFSIGILVDDAIVVVENIHRHRHLHPELPLRALIPHAVDEVGGPTILATFTVIAALLPMAFVSGLMGPYMSPIPINASMGMVLSLLVAFIVTPWMMVHFMGRQSAHGNQESHVQGKLDRMLPSVFKHLIEPFLDGKKGRGRRHLLYFSMVLLIVGAASLGVIKAVVLKMLPFDNKSEFQVVIDMPTGTPLETTASVVHALAEIVATVPEVTDYQAYVGSAAPINFNGLVRQYYFRADSEQADIQVNLVDKHHRSQQSHEIAASLRPLLVEVGKRFGARVKVVEVPPGPPVMSPLVAEIYGPDEAGRLQFASQVREVFEQTADIVDVDDSMTDLAPQQRVVVDRNKAIQLGVPTEPIVRTLTLALTGISSTPLFVEGAKYEVPVKLTLPAEKKSQLTEALKLGVKANDGRLVPLSALVSVHEEIREQTRYRKDLLPVTYVMGDMAGSTDSPLYGMFAMRAAIAALPIPNGVSFHEHFIGQPDDPWRGYHLKWDGEWQITYETFRDMGAAYGVGLIFIYLLVVAHFRSYSVPLIIMAPIPLTLIGVMPGHALLGAHFTATSMIGMIALAGIIVRNSILLVDFVDIQLATGMSLERAVVQAASTRAKPIALTGLAAMLGAFFILEDPIFNGLAISLIFGILVSTLLTLVVVPVGYYALKRRHTAA